MTTGVVQKFEFSKKGSKKLQIGGVWYFVGKTNTDAVKVGDKIEFQFEEFGEDRGQGRLKGLQSWKPIIDAQGKPETGSTVSDADILRSVSNVVGSACAAGTIKDPMELEKWMAAAWGGFLARGKRLAAPKQSVNGADPEFDDELPEKFYSDNRPPADF